MTNREIAETLGLSHHTIKNYLFRIFDKMGVSSRTELLYLTMSRSRAGTDSQPSGAEGDLSCLLRTAQAGDCGAQLRLVEHYSRTNGSAPDPVSAYMWCLVSEKNAASMRNQIEAAKDALRPSLSGQQLAEAERMAAQWRPTSKEQPDSDDLHVE